MAKQILKDIEVSNSTNQKNEKEEKTKSGQ